ncbi:hypothetical protein [Peribacillus glennii]|uniref:Uncharacterized protein n=1 Tax=Peribacillus glennii TaxID=2303991 RepID=A0A372LAY8_9BACI|nr:hypothetical protein [Peribacillus glennii]RFU62033.1 hypothetical protein D0466_15705 [Peribacillus glennii]
MKDQEKQVNGQADYAAGAAQASDDTLNGGGQEGNHSLICNNELFNKELWAIVDDTSRED